MGLLEIVVSLLCLIVLALGALAYGQIGQIGRLLLRTEALERHLGPLHGLSSPTTADVTITAPAEAITAHPPSATTDVRPSVQRRPPGFPPGTNLFEFELLDLDGRQTLRSEFHGQHVLLIFINPVCPHSQALLVDLAALRAHPAVTWPTPVLVSTADRDANRQLVQRVGLQETVLLQSEMEVADLLRVPATPMAYLVDAHGMTATPLLAGRSAILGLAASSPRPDGSTEPVALAPWALIERVTTPSPTTASQYWDGLDVGAIAPGFRLPLVDGGELAIESYAGRQVLLVFTDPASPSCTVLAPRLEALHAANSSQSIVLIGRGEVSENRAWAAELALTLPLAVQRRWEVSRAYRQVGTPVAYLLDADGRIAEPVARGADAVTDLASRNLDDA